MIKSVLSNIKNSLFKFASELHKSTFDFSFYNEIIENKSFEKKQLGSKVISFYDGKIGKTFTESILFFLKIYFIVIFISIAGFIAIIINIPKSDLYLSGEAFFLRFITNDRTLFKSIENDYSKDLIISMSEKGIKTNQKGTHSIGKISNNKETAPIFFLDTEKNLIPKLSEKSPIFVATSGGILVKETTGYKVFIDGFSKDEIKIDKNIVKSSIMDFYKNVPFFVPLFIIFFSLLFLLFISIQVLLPVLLFSRIILRIFKMEMSFSKNFKIILYASALPMFLIFLGGINLTIFFYMGWISYILYKIKSI